MEKKRAIIIAVALFLLIGLGTFVFINKGFNHDIDISEEPQTDIKEKENNVGDEKEEENTTSKGEGGKKSNSSVATIDTEYAEALIAVSKAEETLSQEDIDSAKILIEELTNEKNKEELIEKLNLIQNTLNICNQVKELAALVDNALALEEIEEARNYLTTNELYEAVAKLEDEDIKSELNGELSRISAILEDITAPLIEGIEADTITNEAINIKASDESEYSLYLNGEKIELEKLINFKENGSYVLEAVDKAFNKTTINFAIDLEAPKFNLEDGSASNQNIEITINDLSFDYAEIYNYTNDSSTKENNSAFVLTEEAKYTITAVDKFGQKKSITVTIDKIAPTVEVSYNITTLTKGSVIATIINPSEEITVVNNEGNLSYTFEENGKFIFEISDKAGNITSIPVEVNNIDKTLALVEIGGIADSNYVYQGQDFDVLITEENIDSVYYIWSDSEDIEENQRILDTDNAIKVEETNLIKNEDGTYTFKVNEWEKEGKGYYFSIKVIDKAGNIAYAIKGPYNFDKNAPIAEVSYDITTSTNGSVIATIINPSEEITVINNEGSLSYTFEENGSFNFEIQDLDGNISTVTAEVYNIDKKASIASAELDLRNGYELIITANEEIQEVNGLVKNEDGTYSVIFEEIPLTYEIIDLAGNKTIIPIVIGYNEYKNNDLINERDINLELYFNKNIKIEEIDWIVDENAMSAKKTFDKNGEISLIITDEDGNTTKILYNITKVDESSPVAEITINTRNGYEISFKPNEEINEMLGFTKNEDGTYSATFADLPSSLEIMDLSGNITILPIVTKISEYKSPYTSENRDVFIEINFNKEVTLDDVNWIPYSKTNTTKNWYVENCEKTLVATDTEGNKLTILYSVTQVDTASPEISGVEENKSYESVVILAQDDKTSEEELVATIDGNPYTLGTEYDEVGTHILKVMDTSGNTKTINFTISEIITINN